MEPGSFIHLIPFTNQNHQNLMLRYQSIISVKWKQRFVCAVPDMFILNHKECTEVDKNYSVCNFCYSQLYSIFYIIFSPENILLIDCSKLIFRCKKREMRRSFILNQFEIEGTILNFFFFLTNMNIARLVDVRMQISRDFI